MSYIVSADLAATCSALGYFDFKANQYFAEENTLETVKDLIRYLRRDTESHDARRQLGDSKVLQTDLIPLLKLYWKQSDLFDVLLRLLGNLTNPVLVLYNEEVPTDKTVRNQFLQILSHLQSYKEAFTDEDIWAVLCTKISQILSIEWRERSEDDGLIIERILILVRNVLSVPADPEAEKRTDNDVSIHDKVVWALQKSGLLDIILYMASAEHEEPYYMYLLEILSLLLRDQNPTDLADAALVRSNAEKQRDEAELLAMRNREIVQRSRRLRQYTGARHSQFGGTYIVKNIKSINDENELIYHKPLNKVDVLNFDNDKSRKRVPKNRRPLQETTTSRKSTFSLRLFLKDFCVEFLNGGYNRLMENVRGRLVRAKSMSHDETYYLWAVRFFMEFNRHHKFDIKLVSETMAVHIFHFIQQRMENYFDMISSDKKKWPVWSKRLHIALLAYRELFLTLNAMDKSTDDSVRTSAKVIKSNVFYVIEYREFILTLLVTFNEVKMSQIYLLDLMETQHVFMKMLQAYCGNSSLLVQKKRRAKKNKRKKQVSTVPRNEDVHEKWDEIAAQISSVLEGGANIPTDIIPYDPASDVPIAEQMTIKIQNHLKEGQFEDAIGVLRAAREVYPENDTFGSISTLPEEEFLILREIFFAELQEVPEVEAAVADTGPTSVSEDEEDELATATDVDFETDFKFDDFVKRFAHPKVVHACGLVLRDFNKNSVSANHSVLKLLHRVAWDCHMPAMIFQASIFRSFQRIFSEQNVPEYKELVKFATYIVRQFIKVAQTNQKVFMEVLFWKNSRDAFELEEGYGSYQNKSKSHKAVWTEEEEDELRTLVKEYEEGDIDQDPVDWILENLISSDRTRRVIIKKLKELMIMPKARSTTKRPPKEWQEHEIAQLTELFHQYQADTDPLTQIMDRLTMKRPRNRIVDKLLELRLIKDKREVRKKRERKTKSNRIEGAEPFETNAFERELDSFSSDDSDAPRLKITQATNKQTRTKNSQRTSKKVHEKHIFNAIHAGKLFVEVVNKDMEEPLQWIKENLEEFLEDRNPDEGNDEEDVPLVPISEKDIYAMDDPTFKKMLKAIGLQEPANEQEIYWRIPSKLTTTEVNEIINLITQAINKTLEIQQTEEIPETSQPPLTLNNDSSEDDDEFFARLRQKASEKYGDDPIESYNKLEETNMSKKGKKIETISTKNKKENLSKIIESDQENSNVSEEEASSQSHTTPKQKKKRIVMADSDSEDDTRLNYVEDIPEDTSEINLKRIRDSDSESENQQDHSKKRTKRVISDSEED